MSAIPLDVPGAVAKDSDWPKCCCCGTDDMRDDSMRCDACERFGCDRDIDGSEPCPREESERHAENQRKAHTLGQVLDILREPVAEYNRLCAAWDAALKAEPYVHATVEAARDAVRVQSVRVVGAAESALRVGGRR